MWFLLLDEKNIIIIIIIMLGEKSLTWRSSLFLRREVRTVLTTPSLLSASHFKTWWGSDKRGTVFRSIDDLPACFCMGRYLCLEPILPVATPVAGLWRGTCKPYSCRCWSWTLKKGISPCSGLVAWKQKCCLSPSSSEAVRLQLDLSLVHGTVMSAASVGARLPGRADGRAFRSDVRDTCTSNRHFLLSQKKRKKSLNIVTLPL